MEEKKRNENFGGREAGFKIFGKFREVKGLWYIIVHINRTFGVGNRLYIGKRWD
jgi:hypothetical protein